MPSTKLLDDLMPISLMPISLMPISFALGLGSLSGKGQHLCHVPDAAALDCTGARCFEVYLEDQLHPGFADEFQLWHDRVRSP